MPAGPRLDRAIGLVNSPQRGADRSDLSERPRDEEWTEALTDAIQPLWRPEERLEPRRSHIAA
jgi:hypothetical protein